MALNTGMMETATAMLEPGITPQRYEELLALQRSSLSQQRDLQTQIGGNAVAVLVEGTGGEFWVPVSNGMMLL